MPLIGVIDPTHKERKNQAYGRKPNWVPLSDALATSLAASPKWAPWNYELIQAIEDSHQERGDRLSVTALTGGCMRGTIIERKEDYIGSLDQAYASLRGVLVHAGMEKFARPGSVAEWRFYTEVDGQEISGSPDLITYDTLWDYKTTENPPQFDYMYEGHKLQLQFNRYIFNNCTKWDPPAGLDPTIARNGPELDPFATRIQHLAIVYLGPKGPKILETTRTEQMSRSDGSTWKSKVPDVWSDDQVLAELSPRMQAWEMAWESYPKWPAGLEKFPGWAGPEDWKCPGPPLCYLPNCMAKRYPDGLTW